MATYKEIFGKTIKFLAADPPAAIGEGQIWYNDTSDTFKTSLKTAAWASGGNLGTARSYVAGTGTQTAALAVSGYAGGISNNVEEYNGASWSEQANLGTSRYSLSRGIGTQTAGLFAGGNPPPKADSEEYNGTGWSATNSLTGGLSYLSGFGTADAALVVGGAVPRSTAVNTNESFDGTNWTANPATPFTTKEGATSGPATAGVFAGGNPGLAASYEINSTTWTTVNSMSTGRKAGGFGGGAATQTAGWIAGGEEPGVTAVTEHYDGTTWSTSASIATARAKTGGAGAQATGLIFGGGPDSGLNATEEYSDVAAVKTITAS